MRAVEQRVCQLDENGNLGMLIQVSKMVPEGQLLRFDGRLTGGAPELIVGPLTYWSLQHDGRWPWESRFSQGFRELDLDRRRHPRKKDAK